MAQPVASPLAAPPAHHPPPARGRRVPHGSGHGVFPHGSSIPPPAGWSSGTMPSINRNHPPFFMTRATSRMNCAGALKWCGATLHVTRSKLASAYGNSSAGCCRVSMESPRRRRFPRSLQHCLGKVGACHDVTEAREVQPGVPRAACDIQHLRARWQRKSRRALPARPRPAQGCPFAYRSLCRENCSCAARCVSVERAHSMQLRTPLFDRLHISPTSFRARLASRLCLLICL